MLDSPLMKHPCLAWEVRRADGRLVSCLLVSGACTHAVVQYVDEIFSELEEFDDVKTARERVRTLYADVALQLREGRGRNAGSPRRKSGSSVGSSARKATKHGLRNNSR